MSALKKTKQPSKVWVCDGRLEEIAHKVLRNIEITKLENEGKVIFRNLKTVGTIGLVEYKLSLVRDGYRVGTYLAKICFKSDKKGLFAIVLLNDDNCSDVCFESKEWYMGAKYSSDRNWSG